MTTEVQGTILSATGRGVSGGRTIYDIAFSDGVKYTTFDGQIAGQASALVGQPVIATVTTKQSQDGRYTNHYFEGVRSGNGAAPQAAPVPAVVTAPVATAPVPVIDPDEKDRKLTRMFALKAAFAFVGSAYEGTGPEGVAEGAEVAFKLAAELYAKATAKPDETPASVAAAINSAVGEGAVAVGVAEQAPEGDGIPW